MRPSLPTSDFDYDLPAAAIAQSAIEPRDTARLLVVATMADHRFVELPDLLEPGDLVVVNRTRVRAARLRGTKRGSGGAVELLLLRRIDTERWEALIRPARRIRPGVELDFGDLWGSVTHIHNDGIVTVSLDSGDAAIEDVISKVGEIPLPPYFHGTLDDPERYQTVFASTIGSAAAPTAALHFTDRLVEALATRNIEITEIELEVGLDTFRPIATETISDHVIHTERYLVPESTVEAVGRTQRGGGRIVAIGTTVVRTLESATGSDGLRPGSGVSDLFITPGYRFRTVDAMVTNFHAPRTTLIALVAAAIGPQWRAVYHHALEGGYRFLSFGDAMLIEDVPHLLVST